MDWNLIYTTKKKCGTGVCGHSKLKLWIFFWGQGESEWPLVGLMIAYRHLMTSDQ